MTQTSGNSIETLNARWNAARPFVDAVVDLWNMTGEFNYNTVTSVIDFAISKLGALAATFTEAELDAMGETAVALRGGRDVDAALAKTRAWVTPEVEEMRRKINECPNPDEVLADLKDSLDADVLREDYPSGLVNEELRKAGGDPEAIKQRGKAHVEALLTKRRDRSEG